MICLFVQKLLFRSDDTDLINPQEWLLDVFGGNKTSSGERISSDTALINSNVYTCASILGGDIGKLPIHVFGKTRGGGLEQITNHPVSSLLGLRTNPYMSAYTFKELMMVHVVAWGNAYANIEWETSGSNAGRPRALWPLDPSKTEPFVDLSNGRLWYVTTLPTGERRKLPHYDVLHYKSIGSTGLKGLTPISVLREELGVQKAQQKFIGSFYANGTSSRGVLKVPAPHTLDKTAKDRLREEWQLVNAGMSNAHRIAVLDGGVEYQNIGMPLVEAEFLATRKFGIMEVAKLYKVPGYKLGLNEVKYSNMENQSMEYVKNTMQPIITNWEQENDYKLFTETERVSLYTRFNVASELRGDAKSRAEFYEKMLQLGVYTINEVRELEERDGIGEAGDKHFVSLNYTTLDNLEKYQLMKAGLKSDGKEDDPSAK